MAAEVWIRNPKLCIKECLEVGVENFVWDRGYMMKYRIDPMKYVNLHYGQTHPWRVILVGNQGCTEYTSESGKSHVACYPMWQYGDSLEKLIAIIENPPGDNPDLYWSSEYGKDLKPLAGQERRVFIEGMPPAGSRLAKSFYQILAEIQEKYPNTIIHPHGLYSFRVMFGMGFRAADYEPRELASKGKVVMPVGKEMLFEDACKYPKWIKMLGFKPSQLKVPRDRCMFNIVSAGWAGKHFRDEVRWSLSGSVALDPDAPIATAATDTRIMLRNIKPQSGDKWVCNTCSLQLDCKFFREGSVCAVPDSQPVELSHFFKTRDSDTIIDGLGTLLAAQSHRINRAMVVEDASFADPDNDGELDPELTKLINGLFDRGMHLAKLLDPALRSGPKIAINSNNNTGIINASSPAALMAAVVEELTKRGVRREDITPEMVMGIVSAPEETRNRAIESAIVATATDDDDEDWDDDE